MIQFRDNIDEAANFGVKYIVQPGGSVADQCIVKACDELITIPMHGKLNSLNVSSATSAVLFERLRQLAHL